MQTNIDDRLAGTRRPNAGENPEQYAWHVRRQASKVDTAAGNVRRLLDIVEAAGVTWPDLYVYDFDGKARATWNAPDQDAFRALTKALPSSIDSPWVKSSTAGSYELSRDTDGMEFRIRATWVTCEQVQVGTKVEERTEVITPAQTRTVVDEVPVYEWRCPDSVLLDELEDAAQPDDQPALGGGA